MTDIVDFIAELTFDDIPEQVVKAARLCLLDAVGCMVGGMQSPGVFNLAETISEKNPGATAIVGTAFSSTRSWSSFINSHACTFFDLDDGHRKAQGHPGGVIIPLSLMLAAENGRTGKELLAAIVVGYETAIRSALIMRQAGGPRKGSGGWSITGGVAAAAKICKFSKPQVKSALGLAEYYAPQAPQDRSLAFPSSMKEGMAWASHSAITVAELAGLGFDAMTPFLCDAEPWDEIGINWEICSVYFKIHACCRFAHPVLDGLMNLTNEHEIEPEEIKSIKVRSFAKALLLNHMAPANSVAAMYSIPFIIGCFLARGKVGPGEMATDTLNDTYILQIAQKVVIEEDPDITKQFPEKCLARVSLALKNGKTIHSRILSAKGDPDNPYTQEEMRTKFIDLTVPIMGKSSEVLYRQIMHIDHESPRSLWNMLHLDTD
jgi:2-methylcitrate dehydratase PrpD